MTRSTIFRIMILAAVSLLVLGLATPAGAKKGGIPGPPSVLDVTVEPASGFMWANSVGDQIEFEITITNKGSDLLRITSATFGSASFTDPDPKTPPVDCVEQELEKNGLCKTHHVYTVGEPWVKLFDLPLQQQSTVELIDIVVVNALVLDGDGTLEEKETAAFTAYPVAACDDPVVFDGKFEYLDGGFWWGPHDDYTVCAYTFAGADYWKLETVLPRNPHRTMSPSVTVRDGVPGNWCNVDGYIDGQTAVDIVYFPDDGTCGDGGAGGESITVRNTTTYYLATWAGNIVTATSCLEEEACP